MRCSSTLLRSVLSGVCALVLLTGCQTTMDDVSPSARAAVETRFPDAEVLEVEKKIGSCYEVELKE